MFVPSFSLNCFISSKLDDLCYGYIQKDIWESDLEDSFQPMVELIQH